MNKGFQRAKRVKATLYQLFLESIFIAAEFNLQMQQNSD